MFYNLKLFKQIICKMCTTPIENNSKVSILDQYFLIEVKIIKEGYDMIVGGNLKKKCLV